MADLVITASNVTPEESGVIRETVTASGTVTPGQPAYKKLDGKFAATDANAKDTAAAEGIALNSATDGQPLEILMIGDLALGSILSVGTVYVVSSTTGGIAPASDLASSMYTTILGVATSTSNLRLRIFASGAVIA